MKDMKLYKQIEQFESFVNKLRGINLKESKQYISSAINYLELIGEYTDKDIYNLFN